MVFSLFIDGLPKEMTRDWLLHIFRGEGVVSNVYIFWEEGVVSDVYVSSKRRRFHDYRFGFVRFELLVDAKKAVRNLDGAKIRGYRLQVSFAMYDKNGRPWTDSSH